MSDLISVLYISRATFKPLPATKGIEPDVGRILQASRTHSAQHQIGGVLFYCDGYFLQCLEGERDKVKALLETIRQDDRHTDIRVVSENEIKRRQFDHGSMKYTAINDAVKLMLRTHGFERFDPYQFDANHFRYLLKTLKDVDDQTPADLHEQLPEDTGAGDSSAKRTRLRPQVAPQRDPWARGLAAAALAVALLALALSVT